MNILVIFKIYLNLTLIIIASRTQVNYLIYYNSLLSQGNYIHLTQASGLDQYFYTV